MQKVWYIVFFVGLVVCSCSLTVETEVASQAQPATAAELAKSVVETKKAQFLSLDELSIKVQKSALEINQLDEQIDALLKEI